jgi:hypothetical protein
MRATKHQQDRCQTIHELADTVGINYGVCQEILTENLNMCRIAAQFVPQLLTNDQKQQHVNMCLKLREKANEDPTFISRIITVWESLMYGYDPETKQQSSQQRSPQSSSNKCGRSVVQQRPCSLFLSMWRGLFTWICSS